MADEEAHTKKPQHVHSPFYITIQLKPPSIQNIIALLFCKMTLLGNTFPKKPAATFLDPM